MQALLAATYIGWLRSSKGVITAPSCHVLPCLYPIPRQVRNTCTCNAFPVHESDRKSNPVDYEMRTEIYFQDHQSFGLAPLRTVSLFCRAICHTTSPSSASVRCMCIHRREGRIPKLSPRKHRCTCGTESEVGFPKGADSGLQTHHCCQSLTLKERLPSCRGRWQVCEQRPPSEQSASFIPSAGNFGLAQSTAMST